MAKNLSAKNNNLMKMKELFNIYFVLRVFFILAMFSRKMCILIRLCVFMKQWFIMDMTSLLRVPFPFYPHISHPPRTPPPPPPFDCSMPLSFLSDIYRCVKKTKNNHSPISRVFFLKRVLFMSFPFPTTRKSVLHN